MKGRFDMYCSKCGKELPEDALFCFSCGTRVETEEKEQTVESSVHNDVETVQNISNSNSKTSTNLNPLAIKWLIRIGLIILAVVLLKSCFGGSGSKKSTSGKEDAAITVAKGVISEQLNDPGSATWNSAEVLEKDNYNRYLVKLDVTATNGFGGRIRERYYVIVWTDGERYRYSNNFAWGTEGKADVNLLKTMNDWNEPPESD